MAETAGEIKPYDPTLRERLAEGLQAGLEKMGTDRYKARQRAQTVMGGPSSNLPMGHWRTGLGLLLMARK